MLEPCFFPFSDYETLLESEYPPPHYLPTDYDYYYGLDSDDDGDDMEEDETEEEGEEDGYGRGNSLGVISR